MSVFWCAVIPFALLSIITMYQPYHPHHLPRPPTLPPKPERMRKCRPRSIFNRKLFNGNMESFIQVSAHLCPLSLHELSCPASSPWGFSCLWPLFYPNIVSLMHWLSSCSTPCLHDFGKDKLDKHATVMVFFVSNSVGVRFALTFLLLWAPSASRHWINSALCMSVGHVPAMSGYANKHMATSALMLNQTAEGKQGIHWQ